MRQFDFLIVTALGEELEPLVSIFDAQPIPPTEYPHIYRYHEAELKAEKDIVYRICLGSAHGRGSTRTGIFLARSIETWRPRNVILAGIAAIIPGTGKKLGSILVADRIVDLTESKVWPTNHPDESRPHTFDCEEELIVALRDQLMLSRRDDVQIGVIISQSDVVKSANHRDHLVDAARGATGVDPIGLEMEGLGLGSAVSTTPRQNRPGLLMIKGAVDFANYFKDDSVRRRAAREAAKFTRTFLAKAPIRAMDAKMLGLPERSDSVSSTPSQVSMQPIQPTEFVERPRLFGIDHTRSELRNMLLDTNQPSIVSVEGLGGLGKTELAKLVTRELLFEHLLAGVGWYAVRQDEFSGGVLPKTVVHQKLTPDAIVSAFAAQLGFVDVSKSASSERIRELMAAISHQRYILVIDNVESDPELILLQPILRASHIGHPSKLLLTSRCSVLEHTRACVIPMKELSQAEGLALLRYEGTRLSISRIGQASDDALSRIIEVVGGNPLALKLSLGLLKYYPLEVAVNKLRDAKSEDIDEFYRWIYWQAWDLLSDGSRQLLTAMRHFSVEGADWQRLSAVSALNELDLQHSLKQLIDMSLVLTGGTIEITLYYIHRLTATFVGEVLKTWHDMGRRSQLQMTDEKAIELNIRYTLGQLPDYDHGNKDDE